MSELQYVVAAGDSPQAIAKKYGIPWTTIYEHPRNAFVKQRKGYPLHPGDKLIIPKTTTKPLGPVVGPVVGPPSPRFMDFLSIVQWNMKTILSLQTQHPSASKHRVFSSELPKADPGVQAKRAGEIVGYTKAIKGLWKASIVLTAPIESAFTVLYPTLPAGTVMTSGYRSDADQARLINNFFADYKGPADITDVEKRRQWLLALTVKDKKGNDTKLKIGRVGGSPHRTGLAFDLSGAALDAIDAAVWKCAKANPTTFPLHGTLVETGQNCVHVNLKY